MQTVEDRARVEAIADFGIVGAPVEPSLVSLAQLAATLCQVPTAVVNIIGPTAAFVASKRIVAASAFQQKRPPVFRGR